MLSAASTGCDTITRDCVMAAQCTMASTAPETPSSAPGFARSSATKSSAASGSTRRAFAASRTTATTSAPGSPEGP